MPGTFSQLYCHSVFAVKFRESLILPQWEEELYKYLTGIVQAKNLQMIRVNGYYDHIHTLIRFRPSTVLSDLMKEMKVSSNNFIKESKFCPKGFQWQESYGTFSIHYKDVDTVSAYIENQKAHHKKVTFQQEYDGLLLEMGCTDKIKSFNYFT